MATISENPTIWQVTSCNSYFEVKESEAQMIHPEFSLLSSGHPSTFSPEFFFWYQNLREGERKKIGEILEIS